MDSPTICQFGKILRSWRRLRGTSQLALAADTGVSTRHISFIETGRARPGKQLILRLAESLDIPPREQNALLESAGLLPLFPERKLSEDGMLPYERIVQRLLTNHEPYPAYVLDRWWNVLGGNETAARYLPQPPQFGFNVIETFLAHAPQASLNWCESAWGLLARVRKEWIASGHDEQLGALMERLESATKHCPPPKDRAVFDLPEINSTINIHGHTVSIVSSVVRFETARDITMNELRVELIFPADEDSDAFMRSFSAERQIQDEYDET